jgi:hypothetical protein
MNWLWGAWIALCLVAGLMLMVGCAGPGFPWSPVRNLYNLCIHEGGEPERCEAWAWVEGDRVTAGKMGGVLVFPVGPGR